MGRWNRKKVMHCVVMSAVLLAIILSILNIFLTGRLERFLKKELVERTSEATDGFYRLSFDQLSVSFFRGELKVKGVILKPDSSVFNRWAALDSLPQTYVSTHIGEIHFGGVNLTWRWNYRQLHFNTFEIKSPDVHIFNAYYSGRTEQKAKHAESKSLYEVISPYIDVLSVRRLNLDSATVSYQVENPVSPITYTLKNTSFHAYDFRLDSSSFRSGKLLYCDNFDFVTNQPQMLLANNDFTLKTDSIRLSTEDSIIYIQNITLSPQKRLWEETNLRPDKYVNAQVKTVAVKGIQFTRKDALSFLTARSFDIQSSAINVFDLKDKKVRQDSVPNQQVVIVQADSLVRALSLYDLISPVLHSVSIDRINIDKTRLMYSLTMDKKVEVYTLDNLDFQANNFLIDSLAGLGRELKYFQSISLEASQIQGLMTARNHRFNIDRMTMNTENGNLRIDGIRLRPLSVVTRNDYMQGSIDTVRIDSLQYEKGVSADLLAIKSPRLQYYISPYISKSGEGKKGNYTDSRIDIENLLNPFVRYLSIRKIAIEQANATLTDRTLSDTTVYRINGFNFRATDFLIDGETEKDNRLFFTCTDMGFSFRNFDNYLPGKEYRLAIRSGKLSTLDGIFHLQDISLIPQERVKQKKAGSYICFSAPNLLFTGIHLPMNKLEQQIKVGQICLESPDFLLNQADGNQLRTRLEELSLQGIAYDTTHLALETLDMVNPVIDLQTTIQSKTKKEPFTLEDSTKQVVAGDLYEALQPFTKQFSLNQFHLKHGSLRYSIDLPEVLKPQSGENTFDLSLTGLRIETDKRQTHLDDIRFHTSNIQIPLDNGFYNLKIGELDFRDQNLQLKRIHLISPYPKFEFAALQPKHQDWFDVEVGEIVLNKIDLPRYFADRILQIDELLIDRVLLQNLKNRKVSAERHIVPMIYSGLQKAPVRLRVNKANVTDFNVVYEELAVKGTEPGKLTFTDLNGRFSGLTNIISMPDQYITLEATGNLMEKGAFSAVWKLPVDSLNDRFLLTGHLDSLDLTVLNAIVMPLAPAKIESGYTQNVFFHMDASSREGHIKLTFPYRNLKLALLKEKNGETTQNTFLSKMVNLVLRHDNPSYPERTTSRLRHVDLIIQRDPYHSTFNYLWQMLQPALVESVGIPKREQDAARKVAGFFGRVKRFFKPDKKKIPVETEMDINNIK